MKKNIILTGEPGSGKSTLLIKVVEELETKMPGICLGMYTKEIKEDGIRVGFRMANAIIAHVNSDSKTRVSKYGVEVDMISDRALDRIRSFPDDPALVLYLDEIGQMQLHSQIFKKLVKKCLDSTNICIATLSSVYHSQFTRAVRKRKDIEIINVTPENREELPQLILEKIKTLIDH